MEPERTRGAWVSALLATLLSFGVYVANLRLVSAGDNYPARYLPFGILKHRSLTLAPIADVVAQGESHPHWWVERKGRLYSQYPVAVPVLVTPLYVPAALYLHWTGWTDDRLDQVARVMEKLTSALIASLSVGLMHLLLVRRTRCRWPRLLTLAYALGSNTWMIGSQALWQHGLAELLLVAALYLLLGPCTAAREWAVGLCLALVAACRPPDALLAGPLGLYAIFWARGRVWRLLTSVAIPAALVVAYNYRVANHFAGGYIYHGLDAFRYNPFSGLVGLLFSPARGLFVFTPFLLFLPLGAAATLREPRVRWLALLVLGGVAAQLAMYAGLDWRAGCAWGPRWLTDMLPLLVWLLAAGLERLNRVGLGAFVATVGLSIAVQAVGAFWYTGASDAVLMSDAGDPNRSALAWDLGNTPFLAELRHAPAPRELFSTPLGCIDRVAVDGCDVDEIVPGADLTIFGWALADRRTPAVVRVTLTPTGNTPWSLSRRYPIGATDRFGPRPDVTRALQATGPCDWQVSVPTVGLDPGPHRVEVTVQMYPGGEFRHVAHRIVEVLPTTLASHARVARNRLRRRQSVEGYWLTTHTTSLRYEQPTPEMNVFVTATIVDLLGPASAGFEENLERARRHLRSQIEASGLVRFHGRPDAPTLAELGRVITPDADDTALAWRIAGPKGDAREARALAALQAYRDAGGLYRTWLAPQAEYVSIDPGDDPNPADVGIQMHVLMWLASVDRAAAASLHKSLTSAIGDDRVWVYYRQAPLVPILRTADLHTLGFPVALPPRRLQTDVPGQAIWVQACRHLASRPAPAETRELLETLAKDSFAAMRRTPPLVFHNDLTARCSRFYWSEDVGYALWLRLYRESAQKGTP